MFSGESNNCRVLLDFKFISKLNGCVKTILKSNVESSWNPGDFVDSRVFLAALQKWFDVGFFWDVFFQIQSLIFSIQVLTRHVPAYKPKQDCHKEIWFIILNSSGIILYNINYYTYFT